MEDENEKKEIKEIDEKLEDKPKLSSAESLHKSNDNLKKNSLTEKMRENLWMVSTFVLGVIVLIFLIGSFSGGFTGSVITGSAVSEKGVVENVMDFIQTQGVGDEIEFVSSSKMGDLIEIIVSYQNQNIPIYVTRDGKYLVQGITPLKIIEKSSNTNTEILKSDNPKVELFVMTHCPYGTQAEKGILPVIKSLESVADIKIRFVHYFMHKPEETETPRQVCIREEQADKYYDYLECFLEDGDSDRCLIEVDIDKTKLDDCIKNRSKDYYALDSELSNGYGVQGSPTLVVNGKVISSARSPQAYLDTICSAFTDAPEECDKVLSSKTSSPGFGYEEGQDTNAQC